MLFVCMVATRAKLQHVKRLITMLDHPRHTFLFHVDRSAPFVLYDEIRQGGAAPVPASRLAHCTSAGALAAMQANWHVLAHADCFHTPWAGPQLHYAYVRLITRRRPPGEGDGLRSPAVPRAPPCAGARSPLFHFPRNMSHWLSWWLVTSVACALCCARSVPCPPDAKFTETLA